MPSGTCTAWRWRAAAGCRRWSNGTRTCPRSTWCWRKPTARAPSKPRCWMPGPSLRELQQAFWDAVTRPGGVDADAPVLAVIDPSDRLTPAGRLDIYAGMYVARLTDVLREDFPRVEAILGHERFHDAVHAYLARHPSAHPSVRHVGRDFPAFVGGHAPDLPFLADLARLEWA